MEFSHIPVLLEECMEALAIRPDGIYLDGTAGGGGHSFEIARRLTSGRLIAVDKDRQAITAAGRRLASFPLAQVVQGDFADIPQILLNLSLPGADGVLLDLGVSSHQLDTPERGFSYSVDAPLDMRMSGEGQSAADLLNCAAEEELAHIFFRYGEEKFSRRIAKSIVEARQVKPLETTGELVELIRSSIPAAARREGGHPAKRVFQAVRIAVNGELDSLERALNGIFEILNPGGRFAVITFHSLEDRMVKQAFAALAKGCTCPPDFPVCVCGKTPRGRLVTKKPVLPGKEELAKNPRSKSAKLRTIEKL